MGTIVGNLLRSGKSLVKGVLSSNPITGAAVSLIDSFGKKKEGVTTTSAPINPSTPLNQMSVNSSFPWSTPPVDQNKTVAQGGIYIGTQKTWFEQYGTIAVAVFFGLITVVVLIFKRK